MQQQSVLYYKASFSFGKIGHGKYDLGMRCIVPNSLPDKSLTKSGGLKAKNPSIIKIAGLGCMRFGNAFQAAEIKAVAYENLEEFSDEDDELCPVECVREFNTDEEFLKILEKAKETDSLVVVDFYRTSCGSCKYIEQIFSKLCKGSGDQDGSVVFLKHNVIDEYDEQSEVADRLRIKAVPLFHFYKNGVLLEAFPTRDKERIIAAILKYTAPVSQDV
ncbi:Thioredoxin-like [Actinidia chinensis var. chinensis]|uniref:Thioredoxin-like 4, chloroplastic n=1 Tax=Actinidia chinensis var. chinensis TaxID=1590841 RepID=A0A2R6RN00_ACTCC|nr:Thioredoxin-like [Actinidia chinensis var. chinensis]